MIGTTVSHYRILEKVGGGGMGVVYRADDLVLHRLVALKFLPDAYDEDPLAMGRFLREAQAGSAINHPNICTVYEVGEHEGKPFIAMELLEGRTLARMIGGRPLALDECLRLAMQLADALEAAHSQGVIHRDVKPANILVTQRGDVKVLDFGVAKLRGVVSDSSDTEPVTSGAFTLTMPGVTFGTLAYMPPEQVKGLPVEASADIFSFGAVLYEMATGRQAFPARNASAALEAILTREPEPPENLNPDVPRALADLIGRALAKAPDARPSTREILTELRALQREHEAQQTRAVDVRGGQAALPISSLAVLPFENAARDPDAEYLCEGLSDQLIDTLSQLPRLRVMARSTVFRYRDTAFDPLVIGKELRVGAVLVGRVTQKGVDLLVSAELIDVASGFRLWGEQFNRALDDLQAIEDEITREITRQLRLKLTGAEEARLARRPSSGPAHQAYLTGRYHWNRWTPDGFAKAIRSYERSIALDPGHAAAYAGLADAYSLLGLYGLRAPQEVFPLAQQAAERAIELNGQLAEAHTSLGITRFFHEWDWKAAKEDFARAIEMNPGYVPARQIRATAMSALGQHEEALGEAEIALDLDPLSIVAALNVGWAHFHARHFDDTIAQCARALELDAGFQRAAELEALALSQLGRHEEAVARARAVMEARDGTPRSLAVCGCVFATAGSRDDARDTVQALREMAATVYVPSLCLAFVSAALGKLDTAFGWLERAFDERDSLLVWLRVDPRLDPLRADERFAHVVERVGLRLF